MQQRKQKKVKDFLRNNVNRQALAFLVRHMENESTEEEVKSELLKRNRVFVNTVLMLADQCTRTRFEVGKDKTPNSSYAMSIKAKLKRMLNDPLIDNNIFKSIYQKGTVFGDFMSPKTAFDVFITQYPLYEDRETKHARKKYDFFQTFPAMIGAIRQNSKIRKYPAYHGFNVQQRFIAAELQKSYEKIKGLPEIAKLKPVARADMLEKLFVDAYNSNKPLNYDNIFQCLLGLPIEQPKPVPKAKPKKKPKRKAKQKPGQRKPAK